MKIVKIQGGLGNQMLQYALAYKLKSLFPQEKVLIDISNYKGYQWHPYELDYVFDIDIPAANFLQLGRFFVSPFSDYTQTGRFFNRIPKRHLYVEKETFAYDDKVLSVEGDTYYDGYWFNEQYFSDIRSKLLDAFSFKRQLNSSSQQYLSEIEATNSVGIHVRRGNYLLFDEYKDICERPYYEKAINYIKSKVSQPHFFVFSNDIEWCRQNLTGLMENYTLAVNRDPKNNYVDMQLMSCCKYNIIAHSSFSWWAAWLNQNENRIVVAPNKWVNNNQLHNKPQLKEWVLF